MHEPPFGKPSPGLWIVRDQIDGGVRRGVGADPLVGKPFRVVVGADAVDPPAEHQALGVGAVAGEEDSVVVVFDENADLAGGMTRDGHERDVAGFGQAQALRERPQRLRLELEQVWSEPAGQCVFAT